jgi:hypothetical protein
VKILKKSQIKDYRDKEKEKVDGICPLFEVPLDTNTKTRSCLDHSHDIPRKGEDNSECGRVRGVLSNTSNMLLGRLEKYWNKYGNKNTHLTFSEFLRNCADYMDQDFSNNPLHHTEVDMWRKRLKRWRLVTILSKLREEGIDTTLIKLKRDAINLYVDKVIVPLYFNDKRK